MKTKMKKWNTHQNYFLHYFLYVFLLRWQRLVVTRYKHRLKFWMKYFSWFFLFNVILFDVEWIAVILPSDLNYSKLFFFIVISKKSFFICSEKSCLIWFWLAMYRFQYGTLLKIECISIKCFKVKWVCK